MFEGVKARKNMTRSWSWPWPWSISIGFATSLIPSTKRDYAKDHIQFPLIFGQRLEAVECTVPYPGLVSYNLQHFCLNRTLSYSRINIVNFVKQTVRRKTERLEMPRKSMRELVPEENTRSFPIRWKKCRKILTKHNHSDS